MAWIKRVYLYMVSLISLIILVIAGIILINLALKTWVFTQADTNIYYSAPCPIATPDNAVNTQCSDPKYLAQQEEQQKQDRKAQKERDASQALAMIIVASPVFYYHWRLARKEV